MQLLLDTHAFLWWLDGDKSLPLSIQTLLEEESNTVFISAASAWEVTTKHRIGKLPGAEAVARAFGECIVNQGFVGLPISIEHAERAGIMKGEHRDPFDRMLISQSLIEKIPIVSNEGIFDAFGVERVWE